MKTRIAVLMGGPSAEHDISLKTGEMVLRYLDPEKYASKKVVVAKNGKWPISFKNLRDNFDLVFIAMHGEYGEDGTVQKILDKYKISYTGSGAKASALGMDKEKSAKLFQKAGLNVPSFTVISGNPELSKIKLLMSFPLVVKPVDRGSSVGVGLVKKISELPEAWKLASRYSQNVMLQKYISGREFTCGVLEIKGRPTALIPTEIVPKYRNFFDYYSKYTAGGSKEITPPKISPAEIKAIQKIAVTAHKAIGARGMSRTDIILENPKSEIRNPKFYVLEINTIPGMTPTSLLPQQARAAGIEFPAMLDLIIKSAISK